MQDFQKLDVWHRAHALSLRVDTEIRRFPRGYATLKAQLGSAADSIPATIVEGCGAATQREFARYLDMSIKSTSETQYHCISARDRGVMTHETCRVLTDEAVEIRRMLYSLRKRILDDLD